MSTHSKLWNDLPPEQRQRLMPYHIESQILHIRQCKAVAIRNHKRHMRELDDWIKNLERGLSEYNNQISHSGADNQPKES